MPSGTALLAIGPMTTVSQVQVVQPVQPVQPVLSIAWATLLLSEHLPWTPPSAASS